MISNENVIDYKGLDLIKIYNFDSCDYKAVDLIKIYNFDSCDFSIRVRLNNLNKKLNFKIQEL